MTSINELTPPIVNQIFTPNDRKNENTMLSDFEHLHNTNGFFLDFNFDSLNNKYGHSLFVKEGSIRYQDRSFILAPGTTLQYNITNRFPMLSK
jgi:hypothetical protein